MLHGLFWWGIAKILYFMGLNFENLYGRNTIGMLSSCSWDRYVWWWWNQLVAGRLGHIWCLKYHEENLLQIKDMVSVSAGLATINEESRVIRLVHYTTEEFFDQTRERCFPNAETDITKVCVTYLSFHAFGRGFVKQTSSLTSGSGWTSCTTTWHTTGEIMLARLRPYAGKLLTSSRANSRLRLPAKHQ